MLSAEHLLIERYRIESLLGQGGSSAVYRAYDMVLERTVAIKQLRPEPLPGETIPEQIRAQFKREAQILASLSHPNLPRVTDYFVDQGFQYLVMDYIAGKSLDELVLEHDGGLDEGQVLDWADQLLSALEYIHQHGIIHRDVKPSNVRLTPDGRIFLVDFGLFKSMDSVDPRTISVMRGLGTPQYAPPEQYDSGLGHTDARSDIYSLGATLYHLLAGRAPASVTQRMYDPAAFLSVREQGADISPEVERVILRAMQVQRTDRFASAADMRSALKQARAWPANDPGVTKSLQAESPAQPHRQARSRQHRSALLSVLGLLALGGLASTIAVAVQLTSMIPTAAPYHVTPSRLMVSRDTHPPSPKWTSTATETPSTPTTTVTPTLPILNIEVTVTAQNVIPSNTPQGHSSQPTLTPTPKPHPTQKPLPTQQPPPTQRPKPTKKSK